MRQKKSKIIFSLSNQLYECNHLNIHSVSREKEIQPIYRRSLMVWKKWILIENLRSNWLLLLKSRGGMHLCWVVQSTMHFFSPLYYTIHFTKSKNMQSWVKYLVFLSSKSYWWWSECHWGETVCVRTISLWWKWGIHIHLMSKCRK